MLGMANHPAPPLAVKESDLEVLRALVRARTTEQRLVQRARIVLHAAQGTPNRTIAAAVGVAPMTVLLWRTKYARDGLAGLADEPRPGRPPTYSREDRDRVIALTLEPPSDGTTHWSAPRSAYSRRLPGVPPADRPDVPRSGAARHSRQRLDPQDARRPGVA